MANTDGAKWPLGQKPTIALIAQFITKTIENNEDITLFPPACFRRRAQGFP